MRLGILGGTFDPVHIGHLILAECCREALALDRVWFVPAASPPHKQQREITSADARLEMLALAIGGHEPFETNRIEIDRRGLSYTVDTLRQIRADRPDDELFLLLGGDSLADLPQWRDPTEICRLATPVAVADGDPGEVDLGGLAGILDTHRLAWIRDNVVRMPAIGVRASDLRVRVAAGRSIRFQTARAVEKYIEAHGLYRGTRG